MIKNMKISYILFAFIALMLSSCDNQGPASLTDNSIVFNPKLSYDTLTDIDGNTYHTITIGTQTWMASNLRVTRYLNGDKIGTTSHATKDISSETTPKYQWAYDGDEKNVAEYGRLYTWYAMNDSRKLAPSGWHIASDTDWAILETYVSDSLRTSPNTAKAIAGSTDWAVTDTLKTVIGNNLSLNNSSGLTLLPGGRRYLTGAFNGIGKFGYFWSSVQFDEGNAMFKVLGYNNDALVKTNGNKQYGFSVRCVKNN